MIWIGIIITCKKTSGSHQVDDLSHMGWNIVHVGTLNSPARAYMSLCCVFLCFSCKRRYCVLVRVLFHPSIPSENSSASMFAFSLSSSLLEQCWVLKVSCRRNMKLFWVVVSIIFLFLPLPGEMIQFDVHFSNGLVQPPTSLAWKGPISWLKSGGIPFPNLHLRSHPQRDFAPSKPDDCSTFNEPGSPFLRLMAYDIGWAQGP